MTLTSWERRAELPLAIAAVVFLISYSWTVLDPEMPGQLRLTLALVDYATWAVFAVDYVGRVSLAKGPGHTSCTTSSTCSSWSCPCCDPSGCFDY